MPRGSSRELDALHETLPYVVQSKDPSAQGERGEWMTRLDVGPSEHRGIIYGKSAAYILIAQLKREMPHLKWRILKKNEADAYAQGIQVGLRLAGLRPNKHRPLMFMPENL